MNTEEITNEPLTGGDSLTDNVGTCDIPVAEVPVDPSLESSLQHNPYKFHKPAQKKSIDVPIGKYGETKDAILLVDLPRKWERICYQKLRKDMHITLTGMTYFPNIGVLYAFHEGKRGSFTVRPDQVNIQADPTTEVSEVVQTNETLQGINVNTAIDEQTERRE